MDIKKLKEAAEKATPGPWHATKEFANRQRIDAEPATYDPLAAVYGGVSDAACNQTDNNAAFIAAANPAAVLVLIASYERLVEALKQLDAMYARAWDTTDGSLIFSPESVEQFEKAHEAATAALAAAEAA